MSVSFDDFSRCEIKIGKVVEVEDMPQARNPMFRMKIEFGGSRTMQCVAGIKAYYTRDQLLGRQVVAVVNLQPKSVAGVVSECMLLAASDDTSVSLLRPDKETALGAKVS